MNRMKDKRTKALILGCAVLFGAGGALAADWPQWRGPDRDGKVAGFTVPRDAPRRALLCLYPGPSRKCMPNQGCGEQRCPLLTNKCHYAHDLFIVAQQGK